MDKMLIITGAAGLLFFICAIALFFVSRKSQKVMQSLLDILLDPQRAQARDATRVLSEIMAAEIAKIAGLFNKMNAELGYLSARADDMAHKLGVRNLEIAKIADDSAAKIAAATDRIDAALAGFKAVVGSDDWAAVSIACEKFQSELNEMLSASDMSARDMVEKTRAMRVQMDEFVAAARTLSTQALDSMESGASQMNAFSIEAEALRDQHAQLSESVASGFANVRRESMGHAELMAANEKVLTAQIEKMETFAKASKQSLELQMNSVLNTANVVGSQVRLTESSLEKQENLLESAVAKMTESMESARAMAGAVSGDMAEITLQFQKGVKDLSENVITEMSASQKTADDLLIRAKSAADSFSESVRAMSEGVAGTISEMSNANEKLTEQSRGLAAASQSASEQLRPLTELVERYYSALPDLMKGSDDLTKQMAQTMSDMNQKIADINKTMGESVSGFADSSLKIGRLSDQSRQQMIDLLSDYAKAADTMRELNASMAQSRAAAPMEAINKAPVARPAPEVSLSVSEFMAQSEKMLERMHELSVDLTRSAGAEIPEAVWAKYRGGDKTIFSKWFAKMLKAADKKRVRDMIKSDAVFRSQATQFVRAFSKMMAGAEYSENKEIVAATLLKTDLGQMYLALKTYL